MSRVLIKGRAQRNLINPFRFSVSALALPLGNSTGHP